MEEQYDVSEEAQRVLAENDRGTFTVPAKGLYPHQWLWDSCFIAIGLRHLDVDRAQSEILSILRGQWTNGMIPHVIHSGNKRDRDATIWRSWLNHAAPDDISTSGITQPPIIAEAVVRIGDILPTSEKRLWYKSVFPALLAYHQWLYNERDPHQEGLTLQIHPWETGLDNTPPWMNELHEHQLPVWITIVKKLQLQHLFRFFRQDTRYIPAAQRISTLDALALYSIQRRLRRKNYETQRILTHSLLSIEDVSFNAILIRNNELLAQIAATIKQPLPKELTKRIKKTRSAFEKLWDPYSSQYYSREFVSHRLLKQPTIGTMLALYAGSISKDRAAHLVKMLENKHQFGSTYPVPSVPESSDWFQPKAYWQGPTWVNTNWLIIDGLQRYGFNDHADALTESTLELIRRNGCYEYFSPVNGEPAGAKDFSWTAALALDLAQKKKN
jgi:hypothetical protein